MLSKFSALSTQGWSWTCSENEEFVGQCLVGEQGDNRIYVSLTGSQPAWVILAEESGVMEAFRLQNNFRVAGRGILGLPLSTARPLSPFSENLDHVGEILKTIPLETFAAQGVATGPIKQSIALVEDARKTRHAILEEMKSQSRLPANEELWGSRPTATDVEVVREIPDWRCRAVWTVFEGNAAVEFGDDQIQRTASHEEKDALARWQPDASRWSHMQQLSEEIALPAEFRQQIVGFRTV